MSDTNADSNSQGLRPSLHDEIDRLSEDNVAILHQIALQLELESLVATLDEAFDRDRAEGKLDRTRELIRETRQALRRESSFSPNCRDAMLRE